MAGTVLQIGENVYCSCDPQGGDFSVYGSGPTYSNTSDIKKTDPDYPGTVSSILMGGWRKATNSVFEIPDGITSFFGMGTMIDTTYTSAISTIIIGKDVEYLGGFPCTVNMSHKPSVQRCKERDRLTSVIFRGNKVRRIDNRAFRARLNLVTVQIGYTPEILGDEIFSECQSLVSVNFDKHLVINAGMFYDCMELERFNEDNSISDIVPTPEQCLYNCLKLTRLKFEDTCGTQQYFGETPYSFCGVDPEADHTGSNFDENGYLKTYIEGSTSSWIRCHNFKGLEGRILLDDKDREIVRPYIAINAYDGYEGYQAGDMWTIPLYPPYHWDRARDSGTVSRAIDILLVKDYYDTVWCILLHNPSDTTYDSDYGYTGLLVNLIDYTWDTGDTIAEIAYYTDKFKYFDKSY